MGSTTPEATSGLGTATVPTGDQGPDAVAVQRKSRPGGRGLHGVPAWWALPGILVVLGLIYLPTALGGFYAFTDWQGIGGWHWVGVQNFRTTPCSCRSRSSS